MATTYEDILNLFRENDGQIKELQLQEPFAMTAEMNYETDFYQWTQQQAGLLKAGRWREIDREHLVEEIETMGRSERAQLETRLGLLLMHLLKWQYQPKLRSRSWLATIKEQRRRVGRLIDRNRCAC